ncbi:MAG: hypothetical protein K0S40_4503 [Actinomycetospora sp.]|jgi:hypothetical protein|nr:hypothetical protein [Actinomycetospora sp.]
MSVEACLAAIVGTAVRTGLSRPTLVCLVPGVGASLTVVLLRRRAAASPPAGAATLGR